MHGHIWGSLLAAPLLNNNHLPFHSALIVSNSLWQIVADKPPAPPPSVTPTQSPHLYRLSFLIFDFAFKVMCFSPMMKSVLKPNAKWSATLLFHTLSYSASSTRSCSMSPFCSFSFTKAFSLRQWKAKVVEMPCTIILSSLVFMFVLMNFLTENDVSGVAADLQLWLFQMLGCWGADCPQYGASILFSNYLTLAPGTQVYEFPPVCS